jgi:hypothetical protein
MFCLDGERLLCSAIIPDLLARSSLAKEFVVLSNTGEAYQYLNGNSCLRKATSIFLSAIILSKIVITCSDFEVLIKQ